ncbi:MAG: cell division protein FtsQ [Cycloclasticus sp.]|jgi:cell division protein FtsQ
MKDLVVDALATYITSIKALLFLMLIGLLIWQLQQWLTMPGTMPIKQVRIEGELNNLSHEEVSGVLSELVQTGYFAMDSRAIVNKVTDLGWVYETRIRRIWPDTIELSIKEQTPVAVWNKVKLLNNKGELFSVTLNEALKQLPALSGIDIDSKKVLAEQQTINESLSVMALEVKELNLAEHGSWTMVLSNGIKVKAGRLTSKGRISKSIKVLASLDGNLVERVKALDLRYPNGVSVEWKEGHGSGKPNANQAS